jgi:hypothetical protein
MQIVLVTHLFEKCGSGAPPTSVLYAREVTCVYVCSFSSKCL